MYEEAVRDLPDTKAVAIHDDLTIIGPQAQVFAAFDRINASAPKLKLRLRVNKCAIYLPDTLSNPADREAAIAACSQRSLPHSSHLESLGVMFGSDEKIQQHCAEAVDKQQRFFELLCHPAMPVQVAFTLLRYCGIPRLSYLARTTLPKLLLESARRFDRMAQDTCLRLMDLQRSQATEEVLTQVSLPLHLGGMAIRPVERISSSAYFASAAIALPEFLQAFPSAVHADTQLYADMEECWTQMRENGVDSQATTDAPPAAAPPGPTPATPPPVASSQLSLASLSLPLSLSLPAMANPAAIAALATIPNFSVFNPVHTFQWGRIAGVGEATANALAAQANPPPIPEPVQQRSRPVSFLPPACTLHGPDAVARLFQRAQAHISTRRRQPAEFLEGERLQADATRQIEEATLNNLHAHSDPFRRTLLTALSASHSSDHLTVLPTEPDYRLSNAAFRLSVRHRLGVAPSPSLAHASCVCPRDSLCHGPGSFAQLRPHAEWRSHQAT